MATLQVYWTTHGSECIVAPLAADHPHDLVVPTRNTAEVCRHSAGNAGANFVRQVHAAVCPERARREGPRAAHDWLSTDPDGVAPERSNYPGGLWCAASLEIAAPWCFACPSGSRSPDVQHVVRRRYITLVPGRALLQLLPAGLRTDRPIEALRWLVADGQRNTVRRAETNITRLASRRC